MEEALSNRIIAVSRELSLKGANTFMRKVEFDEMRMVEAGGWTTGEGGLIYEGNRVRFGVGLGAIMFEYDKTESEKYTFIYYLGKIIIYTPSDDKSFLTPLGLVRTLVRRIFS